MSFSLEQFLLESLREDAVERDVTTLATVAADARCCARFIAKQDGVLSGMAAFRGAFDLCDTRVESYTARNDGDVYSRGDVLAEFNGLARGTLSAERTALNFVQHLSGIATLTAQYVKAVEGYSVKICDTRKTIPMMRALAKDAVRHGGGVNHRFNLADGVLIKDNHIEAAGGIALAIAHVRAKAHHLMKVEVEVSTLGQLQEALETKADVILLDNMDLETMREAVSMALGTGTLLEASGNMSLDRVRSVAECGVDFISVGALTHSAPAVDVSLLIENA